MVGVFCSCVLLVLLNSAARVPKAPDFSGEWVLVKAGDSTAEQASLSIRQTITRTTMRGEPMQPWFSDLAVVRRSERSIVSSESYKIGLIGGTYSGISHRTTFAVKWQGDSLIIQTGTYEGPSQQSGPYTEHEEVWSLDPEGKLLITVTDGGSNITPTTVRLVYRRRQANGVRRAHERRRSHAD